MRFFFRAVFILLAIMPLSGAVFAQNNELQTEDITFHGNENIPAGEIRKVMATKFPSVFSWFPFVKRPVFNESVFKQDIRNIENLYQEFGYYDVIVHYTLRTNLATNLVRIIINIREGRPSLLDAINVSVTGQGRGNALLIQGIEKSILLIRGTPFEINVYDKSKQNIIEYLGNNGYPNATVEGRAVVDKQSFRVTANFNIFTGSTTCFGAVDIMGNTIVKNSDILNELTFREGQLYSRKAVFDSQRNLVQLGLFYSVNIFPSSGTAGSFVPMEVRVDERKERTIEIGVGYGTEDRFRIQSAWTRRYLLGGLRTLRAGIWHSSLTEGANVTFNQRYFIDRQTNLSGVFGYQRDFFVSYSNESLSSEARVSRTISTYIQGYAAYMLGLNRPVSTNPTIVQQLRATNPGAYYFVAALRLGLEYNTVKDIIYPEHDRLYSLYLEPASHLLGSSIDYIKAIFEARVYEAITDSVVAAVRVRVGAIEPYRFTTQIPIFERFFAGGAYSIRGYGYQQVGPKDSSGNPLGGDYLFESNFEFRFPITKNLIGVSFIDGGNVFLTNFDLSFSNLQYGIGAGVRYNSVVGPLRLDVAFPFTPFYRVQFSNYQFYVSIGYMF